MGRPVTCHKQKYENAKATTTIIKKKPKIYEKLYDELHE